MVQFPVLEFILGLCLSRSRSFLSSKPQLGVTDRCKGKTSATRRGLPLCTSPLRRTHQIFLESYQPTNIYISYTYFNLPTPIITSFSIYSYALYVFQTILLYGRINLNYKNMLVVLYVLPSMYTRQMDEVAHHTIRHSKQSVSLYRATYHREQREHYIELIGVVYVCIIYCINIQSFVCASVECIMYNPNIRVVWKNRCFFLDNHKVILFHFILKQTCAIPTNIHLQFV